MKIYFYSAIPLAILFSLFAMNKLMTNKTTEPLNLINANHIIYKYQDSSIPPQYHRSYAISINNAGKLNIKVTSYQTVINEKQFSLSNEEFNNIKESLIKYNIYSREIELPNEHCTGGTSQQIEIYDNDKKLYSFLENRCNDKTDDLSENIDAFAKQITNLVPEFETLLQR